MQQSARHSVLHLCRKLRVLKNSSQAINTLIFSASFAHDESNVLEMHRSGRLTADVTNNSCPIHRPEEAAQTNTDRTRQILLTFLTSRHAVTTSRAVQILY